MFLVKLGYNEINTQQHENGLFGKNFCLALCSRCKNRNDRLKAIQEVKGTLVTPLPAHLENPNNRQPMAMVTVVNPTARIIAMEQVFEEQSSSMFRMRQKEEIVPGYAEYKYRVKLQHEDGTIAEEIISLYKSIG